MKEHQSETVQRILDAATEIFAEVGFSGARVDEIARRAAVNKATIYYHIGGKVEVYAEVLKILIGNMAEQGIKKIQDTPSPEEQLKIYIHNIAQLVDRNPAVAPIMLREMASGAQHISEFVLQTLARLVSILTEILEEGERQGIFFPTVPLIIHFMIVGSVVFLKAKNTLIDNRVVLPEMVAKLDGKLSENVAEEVEKLVLRAVKKEGDLQR